MSKAYMPILVSLGGMRLILHTQVCIITGLKPCSVLYNGRYYTYKRSKLKYSEKIKKIEFNYDPK